MSDLKFNIWNTRYGEGGVYQDSSGNVGIGSSVPAAKLDVNGTTKITGGFNLGISSGGTSVTNGNPITALDLPFPCTLNQSTVDVDTSGSSVSSGSSIATTSGTSHIFDLSGISPRPNNIIFAFEDVRGGGDINVRLGITTNTLVSTGYEMKINASDGTTGFQIDESGNNILITGFIQFTNPYGNLWVGTGAQHEDTNETYGISGSVDIGGEINSIGIEIGAGFFDSGAVNIIYY